MGESQPQTAFSFPWTSLQLPPRCFCSGLQRILHLCPTACFSCPFLPGFCQLCSLPPIPPSTYPIAFSFFFFQLCSISLPSAFSLISLASCPSTCMFVTLGFQVKLSLPWSQQEEHQRNKQPLAFHSTAEHHTTPPPLRGTPVRKSCSALSVPAGSMQVARKFFWIVYPKGCRKCLQVDASEDAGTAADIRQSTDTQVQADITREGNSWGC